MIYAPYVSDGLPPHTTYGGRAPNSKLFFLRASKALDMIYAWQPLKEQKHHDENVGRTCRIPASTAV